MGKKLTKEEFIERAKQKHGDKYDYSLVEYINSKTKVCIICQKHGGFWQSPSNHLNGNGCSKCILITTNDFIERANEIHENKYDYSKTEYNGALEKVCIICPEHGEFWQLANSHLQGRGCQKCFVENLYLTKEIFIERAKQIHDDKYDYSKVKYINAKTRVCIICPEHGEFWQFPNNHLKGCGCPKCRNLLTTEEFVEKAKQIHGDKYDYSKVNYTLSKEKVCIICPEHGKFWQIASSHLQGQGCPNCITSKMENIVTNFLNTNNFLYEKRYRGFDWLKNKRRLELDFYLPYYNIAIECQGQQHFESIEFFGGQKLLEKYKKNDKIKRDLCEQHNIPLYYINYDENVEEKLNEIFTSQNISLNKT